MSIVIREPATQEYLDYKNIGGKYLVKHSDDGLYHISELESVDQETLSHTFKIMSLYDDSHEGERLSFDDDIIEKKVLYASFDNVKELIFDRIIIQRFEPKIYNKEVKLKNANSPFFHDKKA